jgi:FdhD protein
MNDKPESHVNFLIHRIEDGVRREVADRLIFEEPLALNINGGPFVTLMRTPGNDAALTFGFLLTEGIIGGMEDVSIFTQCGEIAGDTGNTVRVTLGEAAGVRLQQRPRLFEIRSSCSLCGETEIGEACENIKYTAPASPAAAGIILAAVKALEEHQPLFRETGSAHGAALFSPNGEFISAGEDVGRHNALDKAVGAALMAKKNIHGAIAATSGRASYEIALKAARAGIGFLASVSGATSLAALAADGLGLCLIGFARGGRMNIYTHPEQIVEDAIPKS